MERGRREGEKGTVEEEENVRKERGERVKREEDVERNEGRIEGRDGGSKKRKKATKEIRGEVEKGGEGE